MRVVHSHCAEYNFGLWCLRNDYNVNTCSFLIPCLSLVTGIHKTDWRDPKDTPCFCHCLWFIRIHSAVWRDLLRGALQSATHKVTYCLCRFLQVTRSVHSGTDHFLLPLLTASYRKSHWLLFPGNKAVVCRLVFPSIASHNVVPVLSQWYVDITDPIFMTVHVCRQNLVRTIHRYCNREDFFIFWL